MDRAEGDRRMRWQRLIAEGFGALGQAVILTLSLMGLLLFVGLWTVYFQYLDGNSTVFTMFFVLMLLGAMGLLISGIMWSHQRSKVKRLRQREAELLQLRAGINDKHFKLNDDESW